MVIEKMIGKLGMLKVGNCIMAKGRKYPGKVLGVDRADGGIRVRMLIKDGYHYSFETLLSESIVKIINKPEKISKLVKKYPAL
ncbi:MAG: hypothetical protein QMD86_02120 [Patescibacteria group bacterium]|nr:hypothetical protein [Patescibacteria group bacterium]